MLYQECGNSQTIFEYWPKYNLLKSPCNRKQLLTALKNYIQKSYKNFLSKYKKHSNITFRLSGYKRAIENYYLQYKKHTNITFRLYGYKK